MKKITVSGIEVDKKLIKILNELFKSNIDYIVLPVNSFNIEYLLAPDDKDFVFFHRNMVNSPEMVIESKITVCDSETYSLPIYKDWYMTITYHS